MVAAIKVDANEGRRRKTTVCRDPCFTEWLGEGQGSCSSGKLRAGGCTRINTGSLFYHRAADELKTCSSASYVCELYIIPTILTWQGFRVTYTSAKVLVNTRCKLLSFHWEPAHKVFLAMSAFPRSSFSFPFAFDISDRILRYPYVSSLSAHFCPLVRVGSAAPFTASQAEERAAATAKLKTENLAKVGCQLLAGPLSCTRSG